MTLDELEVASYLYFMNKYCNSKTIKKDGEFK